MADIIVLMIQDQDGKSYLFYKVQWQGYERPEDDTWEPETNVNE